MTTTPITRHQSQPAPVERDLIGWLLLYKMDWCERHPGLMFLAIGGLILLEAVFEQVFQ
jgi:hypothetical protein